LSETSPEQLAAIMEKHLLTENGVQSLEELDLEAVYDDVAQELDSFEDQLGDDYPLKDLLNPPKDKK
jgi:cell division protein FtsX